MVKIRSLPEYCRRIVSISAWEMEEAEGAEPPAGDRGRGEQPSGADDAAVGESGGGNGAVESQRSDADGGGVSELRSDVELIILLQKAAVNDAEDVLLVIVPIFRRKLGGDPLTPPARNMISGISGCAGMCGGALRASPSSTTAAPVARRLGPYSP